jgi:hypothetical protein
MSMEESKWVSVGPTIIKNSASEYLREAIDSLVIFFIAARYEPSRACFLNPHPVLHPIYSFTFLHRSRRSNFPSDQVLPPWLQLQAATTGSLSAGLQAALDPLVPSTHPWRLRARGSSGVGEVGVDNRRKLGAHKGHIEGCGGWNRRGSSWIVVRGRRIRRAGLRIDPGLRPWLQAPAASSKAVRLRAGLRHAHRFVEVKS